MERNRSVIICLGGGLETQDRLPERVQARLDMAYELFVGGNFNAVITTSKGTYRDPNPHSITEAEAGRAYLIGRGLSEEQIIVEEHSMDTIGNAFFSRVLILDQRGWWQPTIVTNEFHMPLTRFIFNIVLDGRYQPRFIEVLNAGITLEELDRWIRHEEEMLKFYEEIFAGIRKGDLGFFEHYIFSRNPAYTGIEDETHRQLSKRIQAIWS